MCDKKVKRKICYNDIVEYFRNTKCTLISTEYFNLEQKIEFICGDCGEKGNKTFEQLEKLACCSKCGHKRSSNKTRLSTDSFIENAKKVHGELYDYSNINYITNNLEVEIICGKHGPFMQKPRCHISGNGCYSCGRERIAVANSDSDSWEEIKTIITDAIDKCNGQFPTYNSVKRLKLLNVDRVMKKLGGYNKAREIFGYDSLQKPAGYWKSFDNVSNEIKTNFPLLMEAKIFPSDNMLKASGIITLHFGNISNLANQMGCDMATRWRARDGHFVISYAELILDEYLYSREISHEPEVKVDRYRCDQKVGDYYIEIWGYQQNKNSKICNSYNERRKNKEKYYKDNNLNLISINGRLLQTNNIKDIESYLNNIFQNIGLDISKKHDFSLDVLHEVSGYRWNEKMVIDKIQEIWDQTKSFPTQKAVKTLGIKGFVDIVKIFGGFRYFRKIMNGPQYNQKTKIDNI